MGDTTLSQEEINALFAGGGGIEGDAEVAAMTGLSVDEIDTIGEVSNISMGSAATALFALVNSKVEISTPVVKVTDWDSLMAEYEKPCVLIKIGYTKGLNGSNILVLREKDVKIITDLMMGGDGSNTADEISELHLSAISEAMNQMMGASATSLSSMLNIMVDISPPTSDLIGETDAPSAGEIDEFLEGSFVEIQFNLLIDNLVDSHIMQLYPLQLAKDMVGMVAGNMETDANSTVEETAGAQEQANVAPAPTQAAPPPQAAAPTPTPMPQQAAPQMQMAYAPPPGPPVNVQTAEFTPFAGGVPIQQYFHENIDLIMDVPLEVTVELGRTAKSIEEILDFTPGTIIELNKIAGEPIDVLVNGKYVAKGEVVVIEEAFGVRITEIIK